ncbi:serine/threonine-protein kinase HipA [mine drainage metagenome]|uniref:Serine/threonine-protein kinase HipA n=1 Tax=mine drainage metagenome TaxID=410659 RepID=A0A1J5Q1Z2_9ZZZZ
MTGVIEVHVSFGTETVRAGRLYSHQRRGSESASFTYDDAYLASPEAYQLDPALPLVSGILQTRANQKIFGALSDCAPDRWGRKLIQRSERLRAQHSAATPRSLGEFDFLLGARDDLRQGALRFRNDEDGPFLAVDEEGVPELIELPELLEIAERADRQESNFAELKRLIHAGGSLGGARPKAHVRDRSGRVAIAKFPSAATDTWNVTVWEKVALDLARAAGITVPNSELIKVGDLSILIVDRFDRDFENRIGYVSAMTMLEAADGDQRSYLDIAGVIEQRSSKTSQDLLELWRRMAFAILASNTDDHLRNHGFLHAGGDSWNLSPAFDLNPNPSSGEKELHTAITEFDARATIKNLIDVAGFFRLDYESAMTILREVVDAVSSWTEVARHHGLTRSQISEMEPAFVHTESDKARVVTR